MKITRTSAYALHALIYMVRHAAQLPATGRAIARSEGIPDSYLARVLQRLTKAGYIRSPRGKRTGYVFAKPPEEIGLLELFETIEGGPLFDDCPLRHCECGGTPRNCRIFAKWTRATRHIKELLEETNLVTAAWNHPEHRFNMPPNSAETEETNQPT